MKNLFIAILLIPALCSGSIINTLPAEPSPTIIHFVGANFQKGAKLGISVDGKHIGFMTNGTQFDYTTQKEGELIIVTQGYDQIDAMYGSPIQIKLNVSSNQEYFYSAKWSKGNHLTSFNESEYSKITKSGKKIISIIDVQ
jgi:hypothetical protein